MKSKDPRSYPYKKRRKGFSPRAFISLKCSFGSIPSYRLSSRSELLIHYGNPENAKGRPGCLAQLFGVNPPKLWLYFSHRARPESETRPQPGVPAWQDRA